MAELETFKSPTDSHCHNLNLQLLQVTRDSPSMQLLAFNMSTFMSNCRDGGFPCARTGGTALRGLDHLVVCAHIFIEKGIIFLCNTKKFSFRFADKPGWWLHQCV